RPRAEALVEAQPACILGPHFRIRREQRIVGQAFEEEADDAERSGVLAHALIQGAADPAAGMAVSGRQEIEVAEIEVRRVQHEREAAYALAHVLGDEHYRAEAVLQRVRELIRQLRDLRLAELRELRAQDRLHLRETLAVRGSRCVVDPADREHHDEAAALRRPASARSQDTAAANGMFAAASAAAKPASGDKHGFALISRIESRPFASTRKSTRA